MISVIIPNYNNANFVAGAIQSVLNQTFRDFEIIVVDDGSTDNSREVLAQFDDKIRYIWQENRGLAGARNTGIQASSRELIGLLDADDEWEPEYLEAMVALASKNPDTVVFYCMAQCMDVDGHYLPQFVGGPPVESSALYQKLLRANFIIPSTVVFRRKPIVDAGSFDTELRSCEDWDLWLRLLPTQKIVGFSRSLVRYRVHGSSLSTDIKGMHGATQKVVEKHFGYDDGKPSAWTSEKRRAYGGVYRYQVITFIQRHGNWDVCVPFLRKAVNVDPTLAVDLDFYYELALGTQPVGHRGVSKPSEFEKNASQLERLIHEALNSRDLDLLRRQAFGTAFYALGLVSYNFGRRPLSRNYFAKAFYYRPELILNARLVGNFLRSFLTKEGVKKIKKLVGRFS